LKIVGITTWPPHRDGVALYAKNLYSHIAKNENVEIIANVSDERSTENNSGTTVFRCWKRDSPFYILQILRKALPSKAHVFHIQHGWLLYGNAFLSFFFPILLLALKLSGKQLIITMHAVALREAKIYDNSFMNILGRIGVLTSTIAVAKLSTAVVVHNNVMKQVLESAYGIKKDKIIVIPHGVTGLPGKAVTEVRKSKDIQILSLGFLRKNKGLEILAKAFENLMKKNARIRLLIVGGIHAHDEKTYINELLKDIEQLGHGRILLKNFVNEDFLNKIILESDIVVLLSEETRFVESSGALARVADFIKPIICSKVPKFSTELKNGENCLMIENTPESLARSLELLISDSELRQKLSTNLRREFAAMYWDSIAAKHVELYKKTLAANSSDGSRRQKK
jgi:glycosyltransferase involved in cell wall biosynthesis